MCKFCRKFKCLVFVLIFWGTSSYAGDYTMASPTEMERCFKDAAEYYKVDEKLLHAVAKVESNFDMKAMNDSNNNGSQDWGIMQINDQWFPVLESRFGISRELVKSDLCVNIHVGAWILASNFHSNGFNWNSVGAYNAGFAEQQNGTRIKYIEKVLAAYKLYM